MDDFRLRIFLAVFGTLTMSTALWAAPVEASSETHMEPSDAADASQTASSDSRDEVESETGPKSDAAAESAPVPASAPALESAPATDSDAAAEKVAPTASESAAKAAPAPKAGADKSQSAYSLSLSFLVSSIYNFRGRNAFMENSQADQHALFAPSITGTVFHPGLRLSYAGFFQINGDNRGYLVDSGVGAEQNIAVGFDWDFSSKLTLSTSLTYLFYPFALSRITGVTWPSYLEPAIGIRFRTNRGIRLGLTLSYFAPVQERLRDQRYMYSLFSIGKAFQFHHRLALDLGYTLGYKLFADPTIWQDTILDMEFCVSLPFDITDKLKLVPATHFAWGYLSGTSFGDQYMIYFSLNLVADF